MRIQFIRGLSPENKLELKRLGLNENLIETMEQIEKEKDNILYGGTHLIHRKNQKLLLKT